MPEVSSDYAILEVRPDASWEEIQRAYLDLVKVWHPDRFGADRRLQRRAERTLQKINDAYRRLEALHASKAPTAPTQERGFAAAPRPERERPNGSSVQPPQQPAGEPQTVRPQERSTFPTVALPTILGILAIASWLTFLHYLAAPKAGPLIIRDSGTASTAPAFTQNEKIIEVAAVPDQHSPGDAPPSRRVQPLASWAPLVRPENGEQLADPAGPEGTGAIQIVNHRDTDIVAEIRQVDTQRIARSVYVRSHEQVTIPGIGLGIYRANFRTAASRGAGSGPVEYYNLRDPLQFYEVRSSGETQSVHYVITIP